MFRKRESNLDQLMFDVWAIMTLAVARNQVRWAGDARRLL